MKKILLAAVLGAACLYTQAQPVQGRMKVSPEQLTPGMKATIRYAPGALPAHKPDSIQFVIYMYDTLYHWSKQEISVKWKDSSYALAYTVPGKAGFIALKFIKGEESDNNNDRGYFYMINKPGGGFMPGAYAGYGLLRSPAYNLGVPDYFESFSISDTATYLWLNNEIIHNKKAAIPLVIPYATALKAFKGDEGLPEIKRAAGFLLSQASPPEEQLFKAYLLYKNFLDDSLHSDSLAAVMLAKYPDGLLAKQRAFQAASKVSNVQERLITWGKFVRRFPYRAEDYAQNDQLGVNYYTAYRNISAILIADKKQDSVMSFLNELPYELLSEVYYKIVEIPYEDWKTMPAITALRYSKPLFSRIQHYYKNQVPNKWYLTSAQWVAQNDQFYLRDYIIHAHILLETGGYDEAVKLATYAQERRRYHTADLNEIEFRLFKKKGNQPALLKVLENSVHTNQISAGMINGLKELYTRKYGNSTKFETYFSSLKDTATFRLMKEEIRASKVEVPAAAFALKDQFGKEHRLDAFNGKVVVLDFWATWCAPCKAAMAGMKMAADKYRSDTSVVFFFVDTQERDPDYKQKATAFLKEKGYDFTILFDNGEDTYKAYAGAISTSGIPFKVIIGPEGKIVFSNVGYRGSPSGLMDEIDIMISEAKGHVNTAFKEESVTYKNLDSIHFGATLSLPMETPVKKAALIISGTGRQDRDGTMAGHKMFKAISDSLARHGIAVLRVDDRETGATNGIYETATMHDFALDAEAGISYLKSRPELAEAKIGLIGHSEGGAVAIIVASRNSDVAFVVSLSAPGVTGLDALLLQNKEIVHNAPIPEINKMRFDSINNLLFHLVYNNVHAPDLEQRMRAAYAGWKQWDDSVVLANKLEYGGHFFFPFESYLYQATGSWYRSFISYDPCPYLSRIKIPVFAINGEKDIIANAAQNLQGFTKCLSASGNKQYKIWQVKGLNHLYQHCDKCTTDEYRILPETFSVEVLAKMEEWIKGV